MTWPLIQLTLSTGAVVDVLQDDHGGARCSARLCRHLQVQPGLLEDAERWRCGLTDDAPPVPPHDFCQPRAIDVAEELHRRELARSVQGAEA